MRQGHDDKIPYFILICDILEKFSGVYSSSSTQHKDLRPANKKQDLNDIGKFNDWLSIQSFFAYKNTSGLVCITNSLIADNQVNCDLAIDIGKEEVDRLTVKYFVDTISRKSKAVKIRNSKWSINVRGENVDINPLMFFNRITYILNTSEEMEDFLSFEISSELVSLFTLGQMRLSENKAKLGDCLRKNIQCIDHVEVIPAT